MWVNVNHTMFYVGKILFHKVVNIIGDVMSFKKSHISVGRNLDIHIYLISEKSGFNIVYVHNAFNG